MPPPSADVSATTDLPVTASGAFEVLGHPAAQAFGGEDLHVAAELEDLHHQLAVLGIGKLEDVASVLLDAGALFGVPVLGGHPAGGLRRELERRPLHLAAGKDAVAARKVLVERGFGDLLRARFADHGIADRVGGEAPEVLAQMAIRVEVPVVAIVDQALRRDLALGLAIFLAVVVPDPQARALEERRGDDAEVRRLALAALGQEDLGALADLLPRVIAAAEDRAQPLDEW